jgi:hypothetical protein
VCLEEVHELVLNKKCNNMYGEKVKNINIINHITEDLGISSVD